MHATQVLQKCPRDALGSMQALRSRGALPNVSGEWMSCKALHALATRRRRDFGSLDIVRSKPLTARVVLHAN